MTQPVVVAAARTPIGKRGGWMSGFHATELLALSLKGLVEKAGIAPERRAGHGIGDPAFARLTRGKASRGLAARRPTLESAS